jgi:hypothetical protein
MSFCEGLIADLILLALLYGVGSDYTLLALSSSMMSFNLIVTLAGTKTYTFSALLLCSTPLKLDFIYLEFYV